MKKRNSNKEKVYQSIINYFMKHGYAPTVREIAILTELNSTSTVQHHIKMLISEGKLETDATFGSSRALRIPEYKFVKVIE